MSQRGLRASPANGRHPLKAWFYEQCSPGTPRFVGAISQGQTREEARKNVVDPLREVLAVRFGAPPSAPDKADSDSVERTIAA